MKTTVKLQSIIDEMEVQLNGYSAFLNVKTGEIVPVSEEDLRAAEDEESYDHLPDWQQEKE